MALDKHNFSWSTTNPRAASHTNSTLPLHHTLGELLRVMNITWKRSGANGWEIRQVKLSKMCLNIHKKTVVFPELWSVHIWKKGGKKVGKNGLSWHHLPEFPTVSCQRVLWKKHPWEKRENHHRKKNWLKDRKQRTGVYGHFSQWQEETGLPQGFFQDLHFLTCSKKSWRIPSYL